jgi:hypothetical protein
MISRSIRRTTVRAALAATGAIAAVTLAACGGGQTATGSPTSTSSAAEPTGTLTSLPPLTSSSTSSSTASGGTSAATVGSTKAQGGNECKANSLKLSFGGGDAGMSQQHTVLRFTNTGTTSCTIVGWPGVSYVTGDNGQQVGTPAARSGAKGASVTLAPGKVASTVIDSVDVGVFDASACKPTPVRGYRVYAPDDTASMFIALPSGTQGCAGKTPSPQLSVVTIKAGAGDPDRP